jgi:hypothetical protein
MSKSFSTPSVTIYPFLVMGIVAGGLLAFLITYFSAVPVGMLTFPAPTLPLFRFHVLFYYWVSFYGLMFLLSFPTARSLKQLIGIALIPSLIASLPYFWHGFSTASQFFLILFSAFALNAFHMNYEANGSTLHYPTLFYAVWDSFIKLFIEIGFFKTLIEKNWFTVWASAFFVSLGLYIGSYTQHVVSNIRTVLLLICKFLLSPLAIISLLFILSLLVMVHQHHLTFKSASLFSSIALLSVVFLNGVYQDGLVQKPYPSILLWICRIFIWVTPLFSALALYTLYFHHYNNIHTHGFNLDNFPYFLNLCLLFLYTLAYSLIAIFQYKSWLKGIERANIVLAILLIVVATVSTTPMVMKHFKSSGSRIGAVIS